MFDCYTSIWENFIRDLIINESSSRSTLKSKSENSAQRRHELQSSEFEKGILSKPDVYLEFLVPEDPDDDDGLGLVRAKQESDGLLSEKVCTRSKYMACRDET